MNGWEYLALALELWTAVGLLGLAVSLARRERRKLGQGVASLVGVWVVYLGVLLAVSARQPAGRVAMGQPACFHVLCFTVVGVEEIEGFPARNHTRLVRLTVRVANHGKDAAQEDLHAVLRDARGRQWPEAAAVSGNPLGGRVLAGGMVVSEPVFQLAPDATGLELLLAHPAGSGQRLRRLLVIGDPESLGHRPRWLALDR